jgi:hypothetical protein
MGIKVNFSLFDKLEASPVPHMTLSTFNLAATVFRKLLVYFFFKLHTKYTSTVTHIVNCKNKTRDRKMVSFYRKLELNGFVCLIPHSLGRL